MKTFSGGKALHKSNLKLSPEMQEFAVRSSEIIGENLKCWLKDAGISSSNTWEKLQVSAIELYSWQSGRVSPRASRFFEVTGKLGDEKKRESKKLLASLMIEGQEIRMQARAARWDGGRRPQSGALGAVRRVAA